MRCPVCKKEDVRLTHAKGFLEKKVFRLIMLRPYRCRMCRSRFYRFSLQDGARSPKRAKRRKEKAEEEQFGHFLKPADEKEFRELIAEIAEAERKIFGATEDTEEDEKSRNVGATEGTEEDEKSRNLGVTEDTEGDGNSRNN
ncbi:hypothetical protein MYX65_00225 [Acidobacteria bacterium AH-259-L09]|nr:hypothetical protein [Acidobacteria bacterium AH-259-L09]